MDHPVRLLPRRAGVAAELGLHGLRHSYVTHLIEAGYDPLFVQQQVGHSHASTTALYTSVSADFRARTLRRVLDGSITSALHPTLGAAVRIAPCHRGRR